MYNEQEAVEVELAEIFSENQLEQLGTNANAVKRLVERYKEKVKNEENFLVKNECYLNAFEFIKLKHGKHCDCEICKVVEEAIDTAKNLPNKIKEENKFLREILRKVYEPEDVRLSGIKAKCGHLVSSKQIEIEQLSDDDSPELCLNCQVKKALGE